MTEQHEAHEPRGGEFKTQPSRADDKHFVDTKRWHKKPTFSMAGDSGLVLPQMNSEEHVD